MRTGGYEHVKSGEILDVNRNYWNRNAESWFGFTALPEYGVLFATEDELNLFGDVSGKRMLEIGCGSGHSLAYHFERGAGEQWAIDLSARQLEIAKEFLAARGCLPRLICSPMEADCGIPTEYFDYVYSIYAVGWTTDLIGTFKRIHSYLKPGGTFIFSWKHPINGCVAVRDGQLMFHKSYFDESWEPLSIDGGDILLANRRISTYVNALADAGFRIERLVEQTDAQTLHLTGELTDRVRRAQMFPLSFAFKARKTN